jgi:hypothetical protein
MRDSVIRTIETTDGLYVSLADITDLAKRIWKLFPCRVSTFTYYLLLKGIFDGET